MVLVGLLVSGFQIRGPRDDIAKRVILVFDFDIIKLSLLFLVSYLCSMYWNIVWKLFGMVLLCTLNMKFRTWYKLSLHTFKMPFSSMNFLKLVISWLSFLGIATACLCWLARNTRLSLHFYQGTVLPCIVDQYFLKAYFLGCECGRSS